MNAKDHKAFAARLTDVGWELSGKHTVVIEDGAVGWQVYVEIDQETVRHELPFDDRAFAQGYALGLSIGGGYPIRRSTDLPGWETAATPPKFSAANDLDSWADDEVRF